MKLLLESWRGYISEEDSSIVDTINSISMYRGTRSGDPNVLSSGAAYFISSEKYARTYGDVGKFRLKIQNPKVVDRKTWLDRYDTIALKMNPSALDDLQREEYDSVVMETDTAIGPMYTVMVLDAEQSATVMVLDAEQSAK